MSRCRRRTWSCKDVSTAKDGVYIEAQQGGISHLLRIPYGQTAATPLPLPFAGAIEGFSTDVQHDGALMRLAGWTEAPQWYAYDPAGDTLTNTQSGAAEPDRFFRHHFGRSHRAQRRRHAGAAFHHL